MAHTPGPWVCDNEKDMFDTEERTWIVTSADGLFLAAGIPWEREADARLIAAAPELLAALRDARDELISLYEELNPNDESDNQTTEVIDRVMAAIKKATGENDDD